LEQEVQRTLEKGREQEKSIVTREEALRRQKDEIEQAGELFKQALDRKCKEDLQQLLATQKAEIGELRKDFDRILKDLKGENELVRQRLEELQDI